MRAQRTALAMLFGAGCLPSPAMGADGPVWPPPSADAPAEVAWQAVVDEFRPKGLGRIFRAVAGAERRQQTLPLPRPVAVALAGDRVFVVDTAMNWVIGGKTDGSSALRLKLPDGVQPVAIASTPDGGRILVADRELGDGLRIRPQRLAARRRGGSGPGAALWWDRGLRQRRRAHHRRRGRSGRSGQQQRTRGGEVGSTRIRRWRVQHSDRRCRSAGRHDLGPRPLQLPSPATRRRASVPVAVRPARRRIRSFRPGQGAGDRPRRPPLCVRRTLRRGSGLRPGRTACSSIIGGRGFSARANSGLPVVSPSIAAVVWPLRTPGIDESNSCATSEGKTGNETSQQSP